MARTKAGKETERLLEEVRSQSASGQFQRAHDSLIARAEATRTDYDSQILLALALESMATDYAQKALARKTTRSRMALFNTLRNQSLRCSEAATQLSDTVAGPPYLAANMAFELGMNGKAFEYARIALKRSAIHTPSWELLAKLYDATGEGARAEGCRLNVEALQSGRAQEVVQAWAEPASGISPRCVC
ncbi:MAG: hypothetical protein EBQ96_01285 [Proteobacteria bacterium]|nr:hypothetical protein [Pseudomonadota bacterium]